MVLQLQAKADCEVLVVGAGPSGLLTTLLLAQSGIDVILLEALSDIDNSPRAMAYGPSAVIELERAGVAAEARSVGMDPDDHLHCVRWIDIDGKVIGEFLPEDRVPVSQFLYSQLGLLRVLKEPLTAHSESFTASIASDEPIHERSQRNLIELQFHWTSLYPTCWLFDWRSTKFT
jgi:choline dehydrogenase-like flavoprotein